MSLALLAPMIDGIDRLKTDDPPGWWDTPAEVVTGTRIKVALEGLVQNMVDDHDNTIARATRYVNYWASRTGEIQRLQEIMDCDICVPKPQRHPHE